MLTPQYKFITNTPNPTNASSSSSPAAFFISNLRSHHKSHAHIRAIIGGTTKIILLVFVTTLTTLILKRKRRSSSPPKRTSLELESPFATELKSPVGREKGWLPERYQHLSLYEVHPPIDGRDGRSSELV
jgi:hypothetical protein